MDKKTRRFGTQGRVYPEDHYVVPRTAEVADFINRVTEGRYIVSLRAPADRQNHLFPTGT